MLKYINKPLHIQYKINKNSMFTKQQITKNDCVKLYKYLENKKKQLNMRFKLL